MFFVLALFARPLAAADFPKRPFVLVNEQELAPLRDELARPGWKAELYRAERGFAIMPTGEGVRSNADLWLKREIAIPPYGGHFHHFFCDDGDRLDVPTDQLFHPGPYRCPACGKNYAGERYEGALRCCAHHWLAVAALDLALVSQIERKPEYGAKAAEILLKYADNYPGPHTSHVKGGILFQSLNEAMWVIPLAQAYDLIHAQLSETERAKIEKFLLTVAKGIQSCGTKGNWGSWHLSAVGVVGYAIENRPLIDWAAVEFKRQILDELGDDGLWPESVHTYHYFPLLAFINFAEAAWHAGDDLYHWEARPGKSLLSMFNAPLPYAYPDLRLPAINDGWFQAYVPPDDYELAFHRTREPRFAWVLANGYRPEVVPAGTTNVNGKKRGGLYALLFGKDIPEETKAPVFSSTNFPVLGICALRSTNGAMMTFDYGPLLGHGQRDKMGITLFANGKLWVADYGTPGYGSSILPWYQSTFAHNTIVVDGRSQMPTKENDAKLWLGEADFEAARSETKEAYPGVTHSRTVARAGDYFVVLDRLSSNAKHTYDFYIRSEGEFSFNDTKGKGRPASPPVPWIEKLKAHSPQKLLSGEWRHSNAGLAFWISGNSPITPLTAKCPAETASRKVSLLVARQIGNNAEFVSVLIAFAGQPEFTVQKRGEQITIRHNHCEDVLTFSSDAIRPSFKRRSLSAAVR